MISKKVSKIIEMFILFIVVPGILALSVTVVLKLSSVILALLYVGFVTYKERKLFNFKVKFKKASKGYIIRTSVVFILIILLGIGIIQFVNPDLLWSVVRQKPMLWFVILFVYAFLSVIPQELVYRGFFYNRYQSLFSNKQLFAVINVICFSWCHVFLLNIWVMLITVLGGILFVYTYEKEKSIFWTVVEHSLYGNLVFTLGLGQMLAFPG